MKVVITPTAAADVIIDGVCEATWPSSGDIEASKHPKASQSISTLPRSFQNASELPLSNSKHDWASSWIPEHPWASLSISEHREVCYEKEKYVYFHASCVNQWWMGSCGWNIWLIMSMDGRMDWLMDWHFLVLFYIDFGTVMGVGARSRCPVRPLVAAAASGEQWEQLGYRHALYADDQPEAAILWTETAAPAAKSATFS